MNKIKEENISSLKKFGGLCGITGTVLYILTNFLPLGHISLYALAMLWPLLSIIFVYSIYSFLSYEKQSAANRIAFLFAVLGFTLVACMISVQLAVRWGIEENISASPESKQLYSVILGSVRLVDHGIDVAWDLFIGTSLIFLSVALSGNSNFGKLWGIPSAVLGILLIILNVLTFPWPPDSRGLFDAGPLIGVYIIILSVKLISVKNKELVIS
ncbi:MAG: hypothetical protein JSS91_04590 [Bacteroidetes bacterium]|nr:hypothetical protein [Bacteroidota bacterium]